MTALTHAIRSATGPWQPLIELTKPRLSSLVLFTALVGYLAAPGSGQRPLLLLNLLAGTALVAGGANALNQVVERERDGRMRRTQSRPLPSGRLEPLPALRFATMISVVGMVQLLVGVNLLTALLGGIALLLYVFVYTPLKAVTVHNTLVGAVVGAIPPLMGWAAATDALTPGAWALAAILFVWQLPHFFSIAWLYREDYARGGYRMLSVADPSGAITRLQVPLLALLLIPVSLLPTMTGHAGRSYAALAVLMGLMFLVTAIWTTTARLDTSARRTFLASIIYLPILLLAALVDKV